MNKKRANKIDNAETNFARWRMMLGLTQAEAAELLGKGRRAAQTYEQLNSKTGSYVKPSLTDRIVMMMIAQGMEIPTPWPE